MFPEEDATPLLEKAKQISGAPRQGKQSLRMKRSIKEPTDVVAPRKIEAKKVVDTDSLVAKYEVLMKENDARKMTEERSLLLFQVFDNLLPHLGVFKPILSRIREELYDYVFSDEHHTARASRMTNISGSRSQTAASNRVDRVPHYLLLKKLLQSRDNAQDDLQKQVDILQERLFTKQVEFEESISTMANRNEENSELLNRIVELEREVAKNESTTRRLKSDIEEIELKNIETVAELNRHCDALQFDSNEKDDEIRYLSVFKEGYDKMDEAFLERAAANTQVDHRNRFNSYEPTVPVIATKKEHIVSDIQVSKKLEDQILTVMNTMIEQYDEYLEEQKAELAAKRLMNNTDIIETRKLEREIDQSDQELWSVQERFKNTMEEINQELGLLRQHCSMLEEQLAAIEEEEEKKNPKKDKTPKKKKKQPEKGPDDPITIDEINKMSLDPADYADEDYEEDEFIPHERVFSKYSIMLYYSQDAGKNYYIHQDCRYCDSCHEKTIACPHKVVGENKVISMPHKVTHIKLKRPSVKIAKDFEETAAQAESRKSSLAKQASAKSSKSRSARSEKSLATSGQLSPTPFMSGSKLVQMKNPLNGVLDDYKDRTDIVRVIGRTLTLQRTLSCYEQLQAFIAWQDEHASEEDGYGSVLDNVYTFFGDRYIKEEAKFAAVHDFLSAVIMYSKDYRDIQLFAHSLVGNIDFAACRYILVLSNYIETIEWKDVEDFRSFVSMVYPFVQDEDLESIQMGFVSFSENKISKLHVFEYILYLTLKGREPRIQDLEQQLMQYPSREPGLMNDEEFSEAADHVLQVPDEKIRKALFSETLLLQQNTQPDIFHVHVSKLACILAYMHLIEQSSKLDAEMYNYIEENRPTHEESLGVHGHVVTVDPSIHLLTMSSVKNLSHNIARRDKFRRERMVAQTDDTFFA